VERLEEIVHRFESEKNMRASDSTTETQELDKENSLIIVQSTAMSKVLDEMMCRPSSLSCARPEIRRCKYEMI
jgi:hypothetical protein